jgi:hypothetical protein
LSLCHSPARRDGRENPVLQCLSKNNDLNQYLNTDLFFTIQPIQPFNNPSS